MPEVLVLQHIACEPLGTLQNALDRAGLSHRYLRTQESEAVPHDLGDAAGLIVMGGPIGAYEQARYPHVTDEMRLIENALSRSVPVLGVCLGGQILASVLGAAVRPSGRQEIGWYPVTLTAEAASDRLWQGVSSPLPAFHWHGDCWETPPGAVSLAFSALTPCQAFRFGESAYGFQFHLEVTEAIVRDWANEFAEDLLTAGKDAADLLAPLPRYLPPIQQVAELVFSRWARQATDAAGLPAPPHAPERAADRPGI